MAKMTKTRKRQLARVRRLRSSLSNRGYILPAEAWDLNSLTTRQLSGMTPDWFYRKSEYQVTAKDYTAIYGTYYDTHMNISPGDVISGKTARQIEMRRAHMTKDYSIVGRIWEIIRQAEMRATPNNPAIGANYAGNILSDMISSHGIDSVEGWFKKWGSSNSEFFSWWDSLVSWDYNALFQESYVTGKTFTTILDEAARHLLNLADYMFK